MVRNPCIRPVFYAGDAGYGIHGGDPWPRPAKLEKDPVYGGGPGPPSAATVHSPPCPVSLLAAESKACKRSRCLVWQRNDALLNVVRLKPSHAARAESAPTVEQHCHRCRCFRCHPREG